MNDNLTICVRYKTAQGKKVKAVRQYPYNGRWESADQLKETMPKRRSEIIKARPVHGGIAFLLKSKLGKKSFEFFKLNQPQLPRSGINNLDFWM